MTSDQVASTARPAYAHYVWCDENSIYVELSGMHGPAVIAFPNDSSGLAKALSLLRDARPKITPIHYIRPGVVAGYKPKGDFSEAQRERVRELLKKVGVT